DLRELHGLRAARHGRLRAGLWGWCQVARGFPGAAASALGAFLLASVRGFHAAAARGLRRLVRVPAPGLPFVLVVGFGMAAAGFMVQLRDSVLRPDLGVGVPVHRFGWMDEAGEERTQLPLTGDEV